VTANYPGGSIDKTVEFLQDGVQVVAFPYVSYECVPAETVLVEGSDPDPASIGLNVGTGRPTVTVGFTGTKVLTFTTPDTAFGPYACNMIRIRELGEPYILSFDSLVVVRDDAGELRYINESKQTLVSVDGSTSMSDLRIDSPEPNPARQSVRITYRLPSSERDVRLGVYDLSGRLIRELSFGPGQAGSAATMWDLRSDRGQTVTPGVYFVRLRTGSSVAVTRLIVVR